SKEPRRGGFMAIPLSCACGRALSVSAELAGGHAVCPGGGTAVGVPALGILVTPTSKVLPARGQRPPARGESRWPWVLAALALFLGAAALAVYLQSGNDGTNPDKLSRGDVPRPDAGSQETPKTAPSGDSPKTHEPGAVKQGPAGEPIEFLPKPVIE